MPSMYDFYLCCGAKIISGFHVFRKEKAGYETQEVFDKANESALKQTETCLNNTTYYGLYLAILKDSQINVNEQLLFKYGFRRMARGLNPIHDGTNNTLYIKAKTEGWGKEAVQNDLDSFNPTPVHMDLKALVVEKVDTGALKAPAKKLVGSTPTKGTTLERNEFGQFKKKEEIVHENQWRVGDTLKVREHRVNLGQAGDEFIINRIGPQFIYLTDRPASGWYKRRFEFVRKGPAWEV